MLPLILSANGTGIIKWWVDAAFAVHPNMQGHSGGGLSLGRGFLIINLTKQKLNTRSSTESEIVGADDFMPAICWTQYFMESQGYQVQDNILFQDNKSAILLEKNGKASNSKRMKHVNIWYFFITNHVNKGDVSLVWCPSVGLDTSWKPKDTKQVQDNKSTIFFGKEWEGLEKQAYKQSTSIFSTSL
jgi:hypothetical protein